MGYCFYDKENGVVRCSFTQFPTRNLQNGITSECCDYCIVGDKSTIAEEYKLMKAENGLLLSVRKESR